jgi:ribosomal-protein-alanine N-acetyltransferase
VNGADGLVLRPAEDADLPTLARLHAAGFDYPWSARQIAGLLGTRGAAALIAERAGRPVGFVLWRCVAGEAELITIAVARTVRRHGIGTALLHAVADRAGGEARELFLEVATDNIAATRLYERAGFTEYGQRRDYYRRPGGVMADARLLKIALK